MIADDLETATEALNAIAAACQSISGDAILSCDDMAGEIPGSSAKKRIYPRLFRNLSLIRTVFEPFRTRFYMVVPANDALLEAAYAYHLQHRTRFGHKDAFLKPLKTEELWEGCLAKVREKFGDAFVEIRRDELQRDR